MSTLDTLLTVYRHVHAIPAASPEDSGIVQIPEDHMAQLKLMAGSIDAMKAGNFTFWSYTGAVEWILDSAKTTSSVAVTTVGFLADYSVNGAGLRTLVSGHDNP